MYDIILLNPPIPRNGIYAGAPYGLLVLSKFLRKKGVHVKILDAVPKTRNKNDIDVLFKPRIISAYLKKGAKNEHLIGVLDKLTYPILRDRTKLLGVSVHDADCLYVALAIAKHLKIRRRMKVVLGGHYISTGNLDFLKNHSYVDYAIKGYAEIPLLKLVKEENPHYISGIVYCQGGQIRGNPNYETLNIDQVSPDLHIIDLTKYTVQLSGTKSVIIPYALSRGCLGNCKFCSNVAYFKQLRQKCEYKKPKTIIKQLTEYTRKFDSSVIILCDDAINADNQKLLEVLKSIVSSNLVIRWGSFIKAAGVNEELAYYMASSGCRYLVFGCESGSDKMLELMKKGVTSKQISRSLRYCSKFGILNHAYFINGYPGEKWSDFWKSIWFIIKNSPYIYGITPFKYTNVEGSAISKDYFGGRNISTLKANIMKLVEVIFISSRNYARMLGMPEKLVKMKRYNRKDRPFIEHYYNYPCRYSFKKMTYMI